MNAYHFYHQHTIQRKSYFILLANIFLIILLGENYFATPVFYLMILLSIFKAASFIKSSNSDYAIKTDADFLYLNHGLLFNQLKIPFNAVTYIDVVKKEIHINDLAVYAPNSILKRAFKIFNTKRLGLVQISTSDILSLKHLLNK